MEEAGMTKLEKRNIRNGLLFCLPWIVGFLVLQAYPIFYSFYLSTTEYSGVGRMVFIGLENFKELLFRDENFFKSAYNTMYYTVLAVPVGVVTAISLALAMNQKVKEVAVYRAILYLPSILPGFALVYVWILFTNPGFGLLNQLFIFLKLPVINWIGDRHFTKPSLVILAQYGAGSMGLIFLAALRAIPRDLYESAEIDGAGAFRKFFRITLPMLTPIILYNIIIGVSGGLQVFIQAYLMTESSRPAGPDNSLLFYVLYVYKNAFQYTRMGYAAALSIFLFFVSIIIALGIFKWGRSWVHYETQ
jgi:multiple sugar transport system permease protein